MSVGAGAALAFAAMTFFSTLAGDIAMPVGVPLGLALIGYLAFHLLDRFVHRHPAGDGRGAAGLIGAGGFVVHMVSRLA